MCQGKKCFVHFYTKSKAGETAKTVYIIKSYRQTDTEITRQDRVKQTPTVLQGHI